MTRFTPWDTHWSSKLIVGARFTLMSRRGSLVADSGIDAHAKWNTVSIPRNTSGYSPIADRSIRRYEHGKVPLYQGSTKSMIRRSSHPASANLQARWDAMKPAPPVMSAFTLITLRAPWLPSHISSFPHGRIITDRQIKHFQWFLSTSSEPDAFRQSSLTFVTIKDAILQYLQIQRIYRYHEQN